MELREISNYEAELNDLPVSNPGEDATSIWYALEVDGKYTGFMEVTDYEDDDIKEISFFMVPDIYQGNGYGDAMLTLFLDQYIPQSTPDDLLTAAFELNVDDGDKLQRIFSDHGFEIGYRSMSECELPFETVYARLASKKPLSYKGRMENLSECIGDVIDGIRNLEDSGVTVRDVRESDIELSVAAIDEDGTLEALMLVSADVDSREISVDNLYTVTNDPTILRKFLAFAVENAQNSNEPPEFISFAAANEKLQKVMEMFFDNPDTSELIVAEAEFNLGKYVEQLKLVDSLRR